MNTNAKIQLSDDSSFMRKILKDILTEMGFTNFVEAETGKQAVEKLSAEKPDLLLLDIIMPELDGIGVLTKLKELNLPTKTIVVSAVGQDDMIKEAQSLGAVGYIVKPFDKEKVVAEVNKVLGA